MTTTLAQEVAGEVARRGEAIYENSLRPRLEEEHYGEYLAIDVETGEYVVAPTRQELTRLTFAQGPSTSRYAIRIGYPALIRRGGAGRKGTHS